MSLRLSDRLAALESTHASQPEQIRQQLLAELAKLDPLAPPPESPEAQLIAKAKRQKAEREAAAKKS